MMNMKISLTIAALTAFAAPAAMAASILVDDFTAAGGIAATLQGNPVEIDVNDVGILGGTRTMWASTDTDPDTFGTSFSVTAGAGTLDFGNGPGSTGQAVLIYDGGGVGSGFGFTFADLAPGVSNIINVDTDGLNAGLGFNLLQGNAIGDRSFTFSGSDFEG